MRHLQAIQALRLNFKRRGVWIWLKGRSCFMCGGKGKVIACTLVLGTGSGGFTQRLDTCSRCGGSPSRGYQRILSEPGKVIQEQHALAGGAYL